MCSQPRRRRPLSPPCSSLGPSTPAVSSSIRVRALTPVPGSLYPHAPHLCVSIIPRAYTAVGRRLQPQPPAAQPASCSLYPAHPPTHHRTAAVMDALRKSPCTLFMWSWKSASCVCMLLARSRST